MRRNTLFWGLILVMLGLIFLLDNMGVFGNVDVWSILLPGFLILFGIWILVGYRFRDSSSIEHAVVPLEDAQSATIHLNHWAGRLFIQSGASMENLLEGDFTEGVEVQQKRADGQIDATLSVPGDPFPFPFIWGSKGLDWHVSLNRDIPIALVLSSGAGEARLDLNDLRVSEVTLKTGAHSARVNLPANAGYTRVKISSGVSSIYLSVPQGVAARIRTSGGLASFNIDRSRFPRGGPGYQSSDYDSAQNKVDIVAETGVGTVDIR